MPSLIGRTNRLYTDLKDMPPDQSVGRPVLGIYNSLLALAQEERQDDAVLSRMSEMSGDMGVGALRILVGQIGAALER